MSSLIANLRFLAKKAAHLMIRRPWRVWRLKRRSGSFVHTSANGLKFVLEPRHYLDHYIAVEGIYERRYVEYFHKILEPGSIVIDIGANIGNHALFLHDKCDRVECFEPNPEIADRLQANIDLNGASNIHVHRIGLGNREGVIPFALNVIGNPGHSGFFSMEGRDPSMFTEVELPIKVADKAIEALELPRLDFIKIDVEGLELEVLQGLQKTISKYRPLVTFEHHEHLAPAGTFDAIKAALPGYVIADPAYARPDSNLFQRAAHLIKYGELISIYEVNVPRPQTYEGLLAIPCEHQLAAQVLKDDHGDSALISSS